MTYQGTSEGLFIVLCPQNGASSRIDRIFASFKVKIDETPPKKYLKYLWENAQILRRKCVLVGKIEF